MKPVIGITCTREEYGMDNYIDAVNEYSGDPILFPALGVNRQTDDHLDSIPEYLGQIDGLLLPGGCDIVPYVYFQKWDRAVNPNVSLSRDALEIRLFQAALEANKPIFGICRGIQVMNVAMKGDLYCDIDMFYPEDNIRHRKMEDDEDSLHDIEIERHSRLSEIVNEHQAKANSAHRQSAKRVGDEFIVAARTEDGIIEALEIPSKRFVIGVQYHPERMLFEDSLRPHAEKLFKAFINAASQ